MKCNKKLSRVTELLKDPERGRFFVVFIFRFMKNELGTSKCGSHYVKEESYLQMKDVFAYSSCNAEFINSATKIRALLVTCEFFLINATNADFYRLTCNKNCNNFLMHEDLQRFPEKSFS